MYLMNNNKGENMTNQEVLKMLKNKITEHGLAEQGWTWSLNNRKRCLGLCCHGRKEIIISKVFSRIRPSDETLDTVLHEIAHALVGAGHGHDAIWKGMCRKIGANPERLANPSVRPDYKYKCYCPKCGKLETGFHRRPTRTFICPKCESILKIR